MNNSSVKLPFFARMCAIGDMSGLQIISFFIFIMSRDEVDCILDNKEFQLKNNICIFKFLVNIHVELEVIAGDMKA